MIAGSYLLCSLFPFCLQIFNEMRGGGRRVSGPGIRSRFRGVAGEEQPTALPWVDDGSAIVPFSRMTFVVQAGCPLTGQQIGPFLNGRF